MSGHAPLQQRGRNRLLRWATLALLVGNVGAMLATVAFWPSAGRDISADVPAHVRDVVLVAVSNGVVIVLAAVACCANQAGRIWRPSLAGLNWIQALRLLPAITAIITWPGGDDGPGLGWELILIPYLVLLAAGGAIMVRKARLAS